MPRRLPTGRSHPGPRAPNRRSGDAHARHDPRRLETRLLAVRGRDPRAATRLVAPRPEAAPAGGRARAPGGGAAGADGGRARRHDELVEVVGRSWGWQAPGSSSSVSRPRARGRSAARISSRPPSAGSDRRTSRWLRRSTISSVATSARSGRRRARDIAQWAGMKPRDIAPALERLALRRFRDESGGELLDVPRAPLPDPETPAPVRFLPTWDAVLLVHARRTGVLPEEHRPRIFSTKMPQSVAHLPRRRRRRRHLAASTTAASAGSRSAASTPAPGARSRTRPSGLRSSTPDNTMAA